jgi:hypothetical protein
MTSVRGVGISMLNNGAQFTTALSVPPMARVTLLRYQPIVINWKPPAPLLAPMMAPLPPPMKAPQKPQLTIFEEEDDEDDDDSLSDLEKTELQLRLDDEEEEDDEDEDEEESGALAYEYHTNQWCDDDFRLIPLTDCDVIMMLRGKVAQLVDTEAAVESFIMVYGPCFFKLSSRSAKDLGRAGLCVSDFAGVLDKCRRSQRIRRDLYRHLERRIADSLADSQDPLQLYLVLRKWSVVHREARILVSRGQPVTASSYHPFDPDLKEMALGWKQIAESLGPDWDALLTRYRHETLLPSWR